MKNLLLMTLFMLMVQSAFTVADEYKQESLHYKTLSCEVEINTGAIVAVKVGEEKYYTAKFAQAFDCSPANDIECRHWRKRYDTFPCEAELRGDTVLAFWINEKYVLVTKCEVTDSNRFPSCYWQTFRGKGKGY